MEHHYEVLVEWLLYLYNVINTTEAFEDVENWHFRLIYSFINNISNWVQKVVMQSHMWKTGNFRTNDESEVAPQIGLKATHSTIIIHSISGKRMFCGQILDHKLLLNLGAIMLFYQLSFIYSYGKWVFLDQILGQNWNLILGKKHPYSISVEWLLYLQNTSISIGSRSHFSTNVFQHFEN